MVLPTGGATARWTGFEQMNRFFKARRPRPRPFQGIRHPKRYSTRCVLSCCPEAHLVFTEFPPSLGHMNRMNELLDLEIGWARTRLGVREDPLPVQNQGTPQNQALVRRHNHAHNQA